MGSVSSALYLGSFVYLLCLMTREATSKPLSSALFFAFLSRCSKNFALFGPLTLHLAPLFGLGKPTYFVIVTVEWHTLVL